MKGGRQAGGVREGKEGKQVELKGGEGGKERMKGGREAGAVKGGRQGQDKGGR